MMYTGDDLLMDFTRFASFHCDGALKSRGLQTHACTDEGSKRLHMFTSAPSFKQSQYINFARVIIPKSHNALKAHPGTPTQANCATKTAQHTHITFNGSDSSLQRLSWVGP